MSVFICAGLFLSLPAQLHAETSVPAADNAAAKQTSASGISTDAAGSAAYIKQAHPHCQVIGVQEATEAAAPLPPSSELTVSLIQRHVDDIMTVSEKDVLRAMFYLWSRLKIVVEPAGSLALAPLLAGMLPLSGKRIGLLISGGNIDISQACNIFKDC